MFPDHRDAERQRHAERVVLIEGCLVDVAELGAVAADRKPLAHDERGRLDSVDRARLACQQGPFLGKRHEGGGRWFATHRHAHAVFVRPRGGPARLARQTARSDVEHAHCDTR